MKPEKALELVLRYASLTAEIKRQKKCIVEHLALCAGVSGDRLDPDLPYSNTDSKGRELEISDYLTLLAISIALGMLLVWINK